MNDAPTIKQVVKSKTVQLHAAAWKYIQEHASGVSTVPGASRLHFTRESYNVAHKEQSHTINTTFCLFVYKRFRKNQHQNINENSGCSEYE